MHASRLAHGLNRVITLDATSVRCHLGQGACSAVPTAVRLHLGPKARPAPAHIRVLMPAFSYSSLTCAFTASLVSSAAA
jgi:hypothetical protein